MQISLALCITRCREGDPDVVQRALAGQLEEAVRMGMVRMRRGGAQPEPWRRSLLGEMVVRLLLALGREQEAQEMAHEMRKNYETVSRQWLRRAVSLDQGWGFLWMNRPGRAIECFRSVIDDRGTAIDMRIETLNGLSDALHALGEGRKAANSLESARALCVSDDRSSLASLTECHRLELDVLSLSRQSEELSDHALAAGFGNASERNARIAATRRKLAERERAWQDQALVANRLQHLQLILTSLAGDTNAHCFVESLRWLRERHLAGLESGARIESALALLAGGAPKAAAELLGNAANTESLARQSRYSMDLQYCRSKLLQQQGQLTDSLRAYKQHVEQAVFVIKRDFAQAAHIADEEKTARGTDAARMRLPLKYRGAYQFIVDNLADTSLSVRHVSAHAGVTERSLQLAFRSHLGMTPAELIRRRRMECIHSELQETGAHGSNVSVLDVAARWGVQSRSTLTENYRQIYAETPFETLHGKARPKARP
jgi:AraC-like DNA-binding protein